MQEIDLVPLFNDNRLSKVIVDSRSACLAEAGELHRLKGQLPTLFQSEASLLPEVGQLLKSDGSLESASHNFEGDVTVL